MLCNSFLNCKQSCWQFSFHITSSHFFELPPAEDKHHLLTPFRAGWDAACSAGTSSGVATVWSEGTSHLLAQEPPSRLGEGCTPSAHTSVPGVRGSSRVPQPAAHRWSCLFAGVAVSRHRRGRPRSTGRQGSTAARKGPNAN